MPQEFEVSFRAVFAFRREEVKKNMAEEERKAARRFTEEEMRLVRETDLPALLASLGYQVKRVGQYHTTAEMDSLRVKDHRTWFRYSTRQHGDAITFLEEFQGMKFPEAVNYLLAWHGRSRDSPGRAAPPGYRPEERPEFHLPPACEDQRRVFAYLRKRGISPQVISTFIRQNLLYEDALHHNAVFVGRSQDGKAVFASKRGTCDLNGRGFKGDVTGSDKSVAFRLPCDPAADWVVVFEAPIDLMSFCTMNRSVHSNAVALCGLSEGALDTYLKENPHLQRIVLCLDADKAGREATDHLKEKYRKRGYEVSVRVPAKGKDWNEELQRRNAARQQTR